MAYNDETGSYDCDKCGCSMIYRGWMNGLCSDCWLEEQREDEHEEI